MSSKQAIKAEVLIGGAIKLVWTKPDLNSEYVTHYSISYSTLEMIVRQHFIQYEAKVTQSESIIIDAFQSNDGTYFFKVNAHFHNGKITTSEPIGPVHVCAQITTGPPGTPTKVNATNEMITIEWSHPKCGSENVLHYEIIFRNSGKSDWNLRKINKDSCIANINKLNPSQVYEFKVVAIYSNGNKHESETKEIRTTSSLPFPPGPPKLRGKITNGKVMLVWSPPEQAFAKIEKYSLHCDTIYANESSNIILTASKEEIEIPIESFELGTNHTFTLHAHAGQETSDPVINTIFIDEALVKPACPTKPTIEVLTSTSALVKFKQSPNTNGWHLRYIASYCTLNEILMHI